MNISEFFNVYPRTDFHEMNLDWFLRTFKSLLTEFGNIKDAWNTFKDKFEGELSKTVFDILNEWYESGRLSELMGNLVTPQFFGAAGDGVTDDTEAFEEWKNSDSGLKYVPSGEYLVNGEVFTSAGFIGDQLGIDDYYNIYLRNNKAIISNEDTDTNTSTPSLEAYFEKNIDFNSVNPFSGTRISNVVFRQNSAGHVENATEPYTPNFTNVGSLLDINASGNIGFTGYTARVRDSKESENPDITTYGSTKSAGLYVEMNKRTKYQSAPSGGGYMIGLETYLSWDSDDEDIYDHEDNFGNYTSWMCGYHCTSYSDKNPITVGIMIDRRQDKRSGFWTGINIGSTAMMIDGDGEGHPGTVGLDFSSWWGGGYGESCIKYRTAHWHHNYVDRIAKIKAPSQRMVNTDGVFQLGIGSSGTNYSELAFFGNASYDNVLESDNVTPYGVLRMDSDSAYLRTESNNLRFTIKHNESYSHFDLSDEGFNPIDEGMHLGTPNYRWDTAYITTLNFGVNNENRGALTIGSGNTATFNIEKQFLRFNLKKSEGVYGTMDFSYVGIIPINNDMHLGNSGYPWKDIYVNNLHVGDQVLTATNVAALLALLS